VSLILPFQVRQVAGVGEIAEGEEPMEPDSISVDELVGRLFDEPCTVRAAAAEALGGMGPAATGALPALRHFLDDDVESIRCEAAVAIWKITGDVTPAMQVGVELLAHEDWTIRCLGAEHLGLIGPIATQVIPPLEEALNDGVQAVRAEAKQAMDRISGRQPVPRR
jgi:HEAT repeat protein